MKFRDPTLDDRGHRRPAERRRGSLTGRYGSGPWSSLVTERGAPLAQRHACVRVGSDSKPIVTVLRLATKKPWAIDASSFTPVKQPLYLTGMTVSVAYSGQGLGTLALKDAVAVARASPADAIRLDAFDTNASAGGVLRPLRLR